MRFKTPSKTVIPLLILGVILLLVVGSSCRSYPPIQTVDAVDLDRFAGKWYVVAHIPAAMEESAYDATETYERTGDLGMDAIFRFRDGGFEQEIEEHRFPGFVEDDGSNAVWGVQVFWPFRAEHRVVHLDRNYTETVIGRTKRDYVWVMTRSPEITDETYQRLIQIVQERGYSLEKLRRVPHQVSATVPDSTATISQP